MSEHTLTSQVKPATVISYQPSGILQRTCACGQHTTAGGECEECRKKREAGALQRAAVDSAPVGEAPPIVHEVLRSPGQPLDVTTRAFMEPRFGYDFSHVRVHTNARAAESARAVQALAYTVGQNIVFGLGQYAPSTRSGLKLIAHELTHTIQQPKHIPAGSLSIDGADSPHEHTAELAAKRVLTDTTLNRGARVSVAVVQRQPGPGAAATPTPTSMAGACRIHFVKGTTEFTKPKEFARCMEVIRSYLKKSRTAGIVELHGYASEEGSEEFNQKLSQQRADIVKLLLGQGGISRTTLRPLAKGEDKTYETLEANRRVEVVLPAAPAPAPKKQKEDFTPNVPNPVEPEEAPGPIKGEKTPASFCEPYSTKPRANLEHTWVEMKLMAFTAQFGSEVQDLWRTYLNTPKVGVKGTLPDRRVFKDKESQIVIAFREDPETLKQRTRIIKLIAERVQNKPELMPTEGKTTDFLPFSTVLEDKERLNLPMAFKNPAQRIPGLLAGGFGKNSSDAGDDVRHVDGQFRVTNQGGGTIRVQMVYAFDVLDAIDFCPGAPGGFFAEEVITITLSRLEATPDVPTYDTPFEVIFGGFDDRIF